jgi:hypothetical protein
LFGKFVADARKPPPEFPGRLTSSLVAVKPPAEDTSIALTKEIADFSLRRRPKMTYVNHLFVYPESCSFKYKHDNINLLIEVVLKADDKDVKTPGVNAVYGNLLGPKFLPSGSTSVLFKDKKPVFADEIKLELPGRLTPQHHLLFNLYHITADKKSRDKKSSAVLVGHAFHPIFRDGKIVKDLPRSISIASELPPSYLDVPENQIKWLEQKKICINFRTKVHSSIYAQDDFLPSFSKLCTETGSLKDWDFAMGSTTVDATANVRKVAPQVIMDHFPVIANQLFQVMCTRNETVSREAFLSLIHVLQTVERISDEKRDKNTLFFNYSRYLFKNVQRAPRFVYEEVAKSWLYFLQQKHNVFSANFNLSWFLFEIIAKSMILRWQSANHFGKSFPFAVLSMFFLR